MFPSRVICVRETPPSSNNKPLLIFLQFHFNTKKNNIKYNRTDPTCLLKLTRSVEFSKPAGVVLFHRRAMSIEPLVSSSMKRSVILTSGASGRINALFSLRSLRSLVAVVAAFLVVLLAPFQGRKRPVAVSSAEKGKEQQERKTATVRVPATIVPWKSSGGGGGVPAAGSVEADVAARRSIAARRVMQDVDERTVREFSLLDTPRGDTLFTQLWSPVSNNVRGLVVLLHGLNEHSDRYSDFAKQLNANGFKVYGMDWIGHGGSDGLHAYVHSLDEAVSDLKSYILKVLADNPGLPCFCFGHSTGAAIILKAMLDPKIESRVAGVVVTSPAVGVQPSHPIFTVLAPIVAFLMPRYQFSGATKKKGMPVSRDPEALVAKYSDPLVYTGFIRVRTGYEILRISTHLQRNLKRLRVPFLVLHGTADTVTDPDASKKMYEEASSTDKTIRLLEGFLHDLLFEPERDEIVGDIINWLNCRV
ncbi:hypothetical protein Ddye_003163 [Dipteronia dyeriana]|uniref:Serine aminopeptidase S33 domain-containing protein n=1 Tax=Dipteronia dyeriana TaxID=168575 RepID=A0AAD9XRR6_9ROSI|nr:hypothetical protein Ddye_003163 [Dipteronia dyeriana]